MAAARRRLGQFEFTALLESTMSMAALGIDLLLPAFGDIRTDLGLSVDSTAVAGLVTAYFLGLAIGQPVYGPISDALGRKPVLYASFGVYIVGALATSLAPTLPLLLGARFLWGLGAAGPRVITVAIIRDRYEGEEMSRAMSLVMSVFMLVPVFAPTIGAAGISVASWRWLFVACAIAAGLLALWMTRMSETLAPEHRGDLNMGRLGRAAKMVVSNRQTVGYTLAMTSMYGGFTSYLASSELIFGDVFGVGERFPVIFGGLAIVMGFDMLLNARIVRQVGSARLSHVTLMTYVVAAVVLLATAMLGGGAPPLWAFLLTMAVVLFGHALIIPNFNTMAMAPMGAVAGMASSIVGAVQVAAGALLGAVIDRMYDGTIVPFAASLLTCGVVAVGLVAWAEGGTLTLLRRRPQPAQPVPSAVR